MNKDFDYAKLGLRRILCLRVRYIAHLGVMGSVVCGLVMSGFYDTSDSSVYFKDGKRFRLQNVCRCDKTVKFELLELGLERVDSRSQSKQLLLFDLDVKDV
jgi:hypothetical protein